MRIPLRDLRSSLCSNTVKGKKCKNCIERIAGDSHILEISEDSYEIKLKHLRRGGAVCTRHAAGATVVTRSLFCRQHWHLLPLR